MTTGVCFNKHAGKWEAYTQIDHRRTHLGLFSTEEQAIQARLKAEKEYGKPIHYRHPCGEHSRIWLIEDSMALVEVFPDQLALIDAKNIDKVREGRRWHLFGGYPRSQKTSCQLHQHILGTKGNGHSIHTDHIDRNPLNNLENNLRIVTPSENQFNSGLWKHNTSGIKGVCWDRNTHKWKAQIQINGKQKYLGQFDSIEDATRARQVAEKGWGAVETKKGVSD